MKRLALLVLGIAVIVSGAPQVVAQSTPALASYFTVLPARFIDPDYKPAALSAVMATPDLNLDGHADLIVIGSQPPALNLPTITAQPGRVYFGDGLGGFTIPPAGVFPTDTFAAVAPRTMLVEDYNRDGKKDLFVATHGYDASPYPGEPNRLYLSDGDRWRDASTELPTAALNDFTHGGAAGDLSGRGITDIIASNGYIQSNLAYTLVNNGSGRFSMTRANLPVGAGETMDTVTSHRFGGVALADFNGDSLPDLVVFADGSNNNLQNRRTVILWNRSGVFVESDKTVLPAPAGFGENQVALDAQSLDVNGDHLPDLVIVGTQGQPTYYGGRFVQVLINRGGKQFADESSTRIPEEESRFRAEARNVASWPRVANVLDFNNDSLPDFSVSYVHNGGTMSPELPLVWINDGSGRFIALKVKDFVPAGSESRLGNFHLMPTQHGYSVITPRYDAASGGFRVSGMLASRRYTGYPGR
jgi:hypothetical protein